MARVLIGIAAAAGIFLGMAATKAWSTPNAETRVTLFGQSCLLTGPVSEANLKAIHAISPAQMPAGQSAESVRKSLEKIKATSEIPSALEPYRDRLTKRFEAQLAYFDGLASAKKLGKVELLLQ